MTDEGSAAIEAVLSGITGRQPANGAAVPAAANGFTAPPAAQAAPVNAPAADIQKAAPKIGDYDQGFAGWGAEKIPLLHPFKFRGVFYEAIEVQVPTGAIMARHIAGRQTVAALIASLTILDDALLGAMHGSDYARIVDVVGEFIAGVR